jgi:hypothetical protein
MGLLVVGWYQPCLPMKMACVLYNWAAVGLLTAALLLLSAAASCVTQRQCDNVAANIQLCCDYATALLLIVCGSTWVSILSTLVLLLSNLPGRKISCFIRMVRTLIHHNYQTNTALWIVKWFRIDHTFFGKKVSSSTTTTNPWVLCCEILRSMIKVLLEFEYCIFGCAWPL